MTQDCKHTTKKTKKKTKNNKQQEGGKRKKKTTRGEHRAGPAGGATARHGTARVSGQPTGWAGNETCEFYFFFCPNSRSPLQDRLVNFSYLLGNCKFP
jgi:hypothetical protein